MSKVSVLIPSRNEELMAKTVDDVFANATGEIEVIVVLDGPTEYPLPKARPNLIFIDRPIAEGMRPAINSAAKVATGKYLMKLDAHCALAKGFDEVLKADCKNDWVVSVRRYSLERYLWKPRLDRLVDYHYLSCPWTRNNAGCFMMQCCPWISRTKERMDIPIDDTLSFQGSLWFMEADYFNNYLHGMNLVGYKTFGAEQQEIGFKVWLGGGRVIINKKTWYAHLHKPSKHRGYPMSMNKMLQSYRYAARYWTNNEWEDRVHDFDWLIDKFWPLPTKDTLVRGEKYYWPENWKGYYEGKLVANTESGYE